MTNHDLMHQTRRKALAGMTVGLCGFALMMMHGGAVSADSINDANAQQSTPTTTEVDSNSQSSQAVKSTAPVILNSSSTTQNSTQNNQPQATQTTTQAAVKSTSAATTAATNLPSGQEYGYLDNVSYANGKLHVSGWNAVSWPSDQMTNTNLHHYLIVYDKTTNKQLGVQDITNNSVTRNDVAKVYPNLYKANQSGFSVDFDIDSSAWLNDVISIVSRYSTYGEGNGDDGNTNHKADWWSVGFYANQNNFGWIDSTSFTGNSFTVSGWHATSKSYTEPNRYLIIWDKTQGKQLASVKLLPDQIKTRTDVGKVYSGVYNANQSGYNVTFNTNNFSFHNYLGDELQIVSRYSSSASGNGGSGDYTDYWSNPFKLTLENRYSFDNVSLTNGSLHVAGWHATSLDGSLPYQFIILRDDTDNTYKAVKNVSKGQDGYVYRPDVAKVFPNLPGNAESGFSTDLTSANNLVYGHKYTIISRRSASESNNGADANYLDVTYSFAYNQHAYYIDSINNKSNGPLKITGWMASDASNAATNAYVIVLGDGKDIGRQKVDLSTRSDVAKVYPMIAKSGQSGFSVTFNNINPSKYNSLRVVLRFTADPAGNINGYTHDDVADVTYSNGTSNVHLAKGAIGVDVSSYQGTDMTTYARNGATYAIVKLTEGTNYHNPNAAGQIASARANNMAVMAYHFARFNGSVAEAQAEANYFLSQASSLPKGSILILDDEANFSSSQSANTQAAMAFMQVIKNAGYVPYIYTSSSMGTNQLNIYTIESTFPNSYWVAAYPNGNSATSSPDYDYFPSNPGVVMWQFTNNWKGLGVDASVVVLPIN